MIFQKSSPATPGNCIEITDENFIYTYCTTRDQSQVDEKDIGSLEETAYDFIGKFYLQIVCDTFDKGQKGSSQKSRFVTLQIKKKRSDVNFVKFYINLIWVRTVWQSDY